MYSSNVINLEPIQKFRGFLDKYGIDKVKQIVDSYDSMAIYGKDEAREQIKDYFKIDDDILDRARLHVTKKEGRIISVDERNREIKKLEAKLSSIGHNNSNSQYINEEPYSNNQQSNATPFRGREHTKYNEPQSKLAAKSYNWRQSTKRAVAGVAVAALFVALSSPFARINPSYAEQHNGQGVEDSNYATIKSLDQELGGLGSRVAHNLASEPYQVAAATSTTSPDPSIDKSATKSKTLIGVLKEEGVKGDYSHETDEIRKVRKGEIKYKDASDGSKIWFGIPKKRPKLSFEHKGDEYKMYVEMGVNKELHKLDDLLAGVKVGGKWYFAFDPKERDYVSLNNKEYGALKGKRVTQVILYRNVKDAEGNDVRLIGGSWVYEGLKKERVAGIEKPKFEPEKVVPLKQKKGSGGKLLEPTDFTAPHRTA